MRIILSFVFLFVISVSVHSQMVALDDSTENAVTITSENFHTIYTSFSLISFTGDMVDEYMGFSNASGVVFGWTGGWRISKSVPLFLGVGTNLRYSHSNKSIIIKEKEDGAKSDFLSLIVPVNVLYINTLLLTSKVWLFCLISACTCRPIFLEQARLTMSNTTISKTMGI